MISKYDVAKDVVASLTTLPGDTGLDPADAQEAAMVMLIQELKAAKGVGYLRGLLQFELDCLGRSDVYDVARGGGHS